MEVKEVTSMPATRSQLLAEADSLIRGETLTHEQGARAKLLLELAGNLTDKTDLERGHDQRRRNLIARREGRPPRYEDGDTEFRAYLRGGDMTPRIRAVQTESGGVSTGAALVPQEFSDKLEAMMALYDEGMFSATSLWEPERGSPGAYPILSDEQATATVISEGGTGSVDSPDAVFAALDFPECQTFRTTLITASVELATDSYFDFDSVLAAALGVRLARGAGANLVTSLLSAATLGFTTANAASILPDELFELTLALNPAYLPGASWMMNYQTWIGILRLKDSANRFIFSLDNAAGRMLLGWPVYLSPSFPNIAANAQSVTFGDHSKFVRRQVRNSLRIKVLRESYMLYGRYGYLGFLRTDGLLLASSTASPVVYLAQHS